MPSKSKSKSKGQKSKKLRGVRKPKQPRQDKKAARNWLELPSDIMVNILQRVGVNDRLHNVQKVCTAWREIYKDPAMWRAVRIDRFSAKVRDDHKWSRMCKHAVDRSQGQLDDLTLIGFCHDELLQYIADRSSQLRRLELVYYVSTDGINAEAFKKFSSLEELSLVRTMVEGVNIEAIGYCPLLKTLKLNEEALRFWEGTYFASTQKEIALAIAESLPQLTHLELIGNCTQNIGLEAILDGCCHLESLDLRGCMCLDLAGDLGKRCSQQIKYLRLPHESFEPYDDADVNKMQVALGLNSVGLVGVDFVDDFSNLRKLG
ncbi:putative F-box/LRR-repeat protein 23 [Bidens hawaiensis]|uniref:putative F-box/LRR-repeat protein 23 n=1 Tax=Bidens hawaiensis TaxID=980011 RepID=UPI004049EE7D